VLPLGVAKKLGKGVLCFFLLNFFYFCDKILNIVDIVAVGILSRFSVFSVFQKPKSDLVFLMPWYRFGIRYINPGLDYCNHVIGVNILN